MSQDVVHSRQLSTGESGELLKFSRQDAGWEWMGLSVRRLAPREVWEFAHPGEETACVLLSGKCAAAWGGNEYKSDNVKVFSKVCPTRFICLQESPFASKQ